MRYLILITVGNSFAEKELTVVTFLLQELASLIIHKALGIRTNPKFSHTIIGIRG